MSRKKRSIAYLFVRVALEDAWFVEDVEEGRHDPLEEDGVRGNAREDIEVIAKLSSSLNFGTRVYEFRNCLSVTP